MKKKILIVDFNGSSPTYTHYFSMALRNSGVQVYVLGNKNVNDLKIHKENLTYLGFNSRIKQLNYLINWFYLYLLSISFDIIHFQWLPLLKATSIELSLVKILKRINPNVFYTVHNVYPHDEHNNLVKIRYDHLYETIDNLVFHTKKTTETFKKKYPDKNIILIKHGLFYSGFESDEVNHKNLMVMLGMISPYKGFEDAIEIMTEVKKSKQDLKLHIEGAGDKDYIAHLRKKVRTTGLENQVVIKEGYMPAERLINLYNKAFVTLMPYKKIEQSGVVFTSFGLKVPVISYSVGGIKEVVLDRINGCLVPLNDKQGFYEAILWTRDNHARLKENLGGQEYENMWQNNAKILLNNYFNKI